MTTFNKNLLNIYSIVLPELTPIVVVDHIHIILSVHTFFQGDSAQTVIFGHIKYSACALCSE